MNTFLRVEFNLINVTFYLFEPSGSVVWQIGVFYFVGPEQVIFTENEAALNCLNHDLKLVSIEAALAISYSLQFQTYNANSARALCASPH
jgi:hypothetical protein